MPIMRYPEAHKPEMRDRIVRAAATALRKGGLAGVSIPSIMKGAGLTHGGFYGYFRDRDELVAEAISKAAADTAATFAEEVPLEETVAKYLSEGHVDHPEQGCVVAALGSEGPRQPAPVRKAFSTIARGLLGQVEKKLHPRRASRALSDEALRQTATMVGAVVLARLVDDDVLARQILRAAREAAR